ncbi:hypothetical protein B0H10DRAFT_2242296 [Mycena sp. CBHHK59/15]|nr:hypothetical protein B0H10DRAFT_2242296 [Mycena sp. CBHHK59/15]
MDVWPRDRIVDPNAQSSSISERWPKDCPLDWFNPTAFNKLPARLRAWHRHKGIALPPARFWVDGRVPDKFKTMSDAHFMTHYGNEVLALYNLPTDEEIEQMKENGEDPDEPLAQDMDEDEDGDESQEQDDEEQQEDDLMDEDEEPQPQAGSSSSSQG